MTKQITKKIDVLQAHYFTDDEIYQHEIALYKITTPILEEKPEVSKIIRKYNAAHRGGELRVLHCRKERHERGDNQPL